MDEFDLRTIVAILERDVTAIKNEIQALRRGGSSDKTSTDLQAVKLEARVEQLEKDIEELSKLQTSEYVPMSRYIWVEKLTIGFAGIVLTAFALALVALLIPVVTP